jgi:hypothetical protein
LNIIELNPDKKRKEDGAKLLFAKSDAAKAILAVMRQS